MTQFIKNLLSWPKHLLSHRPRRHSPRRWRRRKSAAIILLITLASLVTLFWFFSSDERVRLQAIHALEYDTGADVELDQASFAILRQIRIKGLRLYLPGRPHEPKNLVLAADDVILEHQPWSILTRRLRLNTVTAYGGRLYLWYDRSRRLSNLQLLPLRTTVAPGTQRPRIVLRNAALQYRELRQGQLIHTVNQNLSGDLFPAPGNDDLINFNLHTADAGPMPETALEGSYNVQNKKLQMAGAFLLDLIDFNHLPPQVGPWQQWCKIAQPTGQVQAFCAYEPQKGHTFHFELENGKLTVPLPDANLPLHNVNARITCTADNFTIDHLNAQYQNHAEFKLTGNVNGYSTQAPFNLVFQTHQLTIPPDQWTNLHPTTASDNRQLSPRQPVAPPMSVLLPLLPKSNQKDLRDLAPTGLLDLKITLNRNSPEPNTPLDFHGLLTFHDAAINHKDFPYPLRHVTGNIAFQPGRTRIGPLRSRHANQRVDIRGLWQLNEDQRQFDLTIHTRHTPVDQTLFAALPPWQQRLWKQFDPSGLIHARYDTTHINNIRTRQELALDLVDLQATYKGFAVPLSNIAGNARYDGQRLTFDIHNACPPSGKLTLAGTIEGLNQQTPRLRCDLNFQNLLLDTAFRTYLPPLSRDALQYAGLSAHADGRIQLQIPDPNAPSKTTTLQRDELLNLDLARYHLTADIHDGHALCKAFPYALNDLHAKVELTNDYLDIRSLTACHDDSRISAHGRLNNDRSYQLHLKGNPLRLSPELRHAFGQQPIWFWDYFNPTGQANVSLQIAQKKTAHQDNICPTAPPLTYTATVTPINCRLEPNTLPYRFDNVNGTILIEPNALTIKKLTGDNGSARFHVKGNARTPDPNTRQYDFNIIAQDVPLDNKLKNLLPTSVRPLYKKIQPSGHAGFDLQLTSNATSRATQPWHIKGSAWAKHAQLQWPLPAQNIDLALEGNARYLPAKNHFELNAQLDADSLHLMNRPLNNLTAKVLYNPNQHRLQLNDISAQCCQGRLAGQSNVFFNRTPPGYELKLQFHQLDLPTALQAHRPADARDNLQGKLAGSFNLTQTTEIADRRGAFLFTLQDAVLGELPVMGQLLHVLNLSLPRPGAFNEATLAGDIVGNTYRFEQIRLRGSAMTLTGGGLMNEPGHLLELVFEVESPHDLPQIPILSSFFKALQPSIMQVRITGPFDEPTVESVALPSLDNALRHLTGQLPTPAPHPQNDRNTP